MRHWFRERALDYVEWLTFTLGHRDDLWNRTWYALVVARRGERDQQQQGRREVESIPPAVGARSENSVWTGSEWVPDNDATFNETFTVTVDGGSGFGKGAFTSLTREAVLALVDQNLTTHLFKCVITPDRDVRKADGEKPFGWVVKTEDGWVFIHHENAGSMHLREWHVPVFTKAADSQSSLDNGS